MKALKLFLAVALGVAVLAPSTSATAQTSAVSFEEAESADDACDLRINTGGPYEVSVDGSPSVFYEDGSVIPVPQGSNVNYLPQERTFGGTAVGANEVCAQFVPSAEPATGSDGLSAPFIAVGGVVVLALLGAAWWFVMRARRV